MEKLELRINPKTGEIHAFPVDGEKSICNQVTKESFEVVRIVHTDANTLSNLEPCQVISLFGALKSVGLNTCGNCAKVLYK